MTQKLYADIQRLPPEPEIKGLHGCLAGSFDNNFDLEFYQGHNLLLKGEYDSNGCLGAVFGLSTGEPKNANGTNGNNSDFQNDLLQLLQPDNQGILIGPPL